LDGESIHGDSSKSTGAYYEVRKPLEAFTGDHTITFTSGSGKKISETFQFEPLRLLEDLPDSVHRGDLVIPLAGAGDGDFIRVLLTDTSFTSWGIDRIDTIMNGRLVITGQQLGALVNGPVHMELIKELDKRVKNKVSRGGRVSVTFGLSREFYLVSSPARP
jgi:hypothetical protein